jgi:hypothetical protein
MVAGGREAESGAQVESWGKPGFGSEISLFWD